MIVYSIILFAVAMVLAAFAILIFKGNVNLINCYHEDRVTDKQTYCKKLSQALWIMASALMASGVAGLFGETTVIVLSALGVLVFGMLGGLCRMFYVQKKYGGGVF